MKSGITKSKRKQSGQGLTEYLILVALIAISSIGIIRILGQTTQAQLANITLSLQGKSQRKVKSKRVRESLYSEKDLSDFMSNSSKRD